MGGGPIIGPCTTFGVITARLPPFRRGGYLMFLGYASDVCLSRRPSPFCPLVVFDISTGWSTGSPISL